MREKEKGLEIITISIFPDNYGENIQWHALSRNTICYFESFLFHLREHIHNVYSNNKKQLMKLFWCIRNSKCIHRYRRDVFFSVPVTIFSS